MFQRARVLAVAITLVVMPLTVSSTLGQDTSAAAAVATSTSNIRVTFRVGTLDKGQRRPANEYNLIVKAGGSSELLSGERVPIPTAAAMDGDESGMMTYVYQNVGFTSQVSALLLDDGRIRLQGQIESSRVRENSVSGAPPVVETRQVSISAILTDGVPLEVTRVERRDEESGYVEIEARILR